MREQSVAVLHQGQDGATLPTIVNASQIRLHLCQALSDLGLAVVPVYLDEKFQWVETLKQAQVDLIVNAADLGLFYHIELEPHVAAILDAIGRPYTGSGSHAGLATGDKYLSKLLLQSLGIATPQVFLVSQLNQQAVRYPLILKHRYGHNSEGLTDSSVVYNKAQLDAMLQKASAARIELIAEEYIDGREVCAGFIGNKPRVVMPFFEIEYGAGFAGRPKILTFDAKWVSSCNEYHHNQSVRFEPSAQLAAQLRHSLLTVADAFQIRDYGRCDFRIRRDANGNEQACVIDINTNPDISTDAGMFRMAAATGLSYPQFIRKLLDAALERYEEQPQ